MGMMNTMMKEMTNSMSVNDREDLMIKLMPMMLQHIDIKQTVPNFLQEAGEAISLYNVYELIVLSVKDKELSDLLKEKKEALKNMDPEKLREMMKIVMPAVMPRMMKMMMPLMKNTGHIMPEMMGQCMAAESSDWMRDNMMPGCIQSMLSQMDDNQKAECAENLINTINTAAKAEKGVNE